MKKIILLGIIIALVVGCKKESEGLTEQDVKYLKTGEIVNCFACFSPSNVNADGFEIKSEESYKQFENLLRIYPFNPIIDCDTVILPKIDFNKYTLIGILTTYGICDSVSRSVFINTDKTKIIYNINIKKHVGFCTDIGCIDLNFALVPKPSVDYRVVFNLKEE